ncbi:MAG: DEAD/DEAH box helicase [Candidatus Omnitrophica bacterium]|nr:DEAD/DEAH box helicase [Candidatus Omnitrophota bacterium]MDD5671339.1 DEAD/DEAH box helicase [Candidatus Omnitrophota bacterium]
MSKPKGKRAGRPAKSKKLAVVSGDKAVKPGPQVYANSSHALPPDFDLSDEFRAAFDRIEKTREHLFLTGEAGTGKTTFLKYFRQNTKKKYVVLAPTGIAAIHIGGQTLHSFFNFPLMLIRADDIRVLKRHERLFAALELVIVDEASMMRADLLDAMDQSLRLNKGNMLMPFGGVQMVLIGDMHQLPPVVSRELTDHYPRMYDSRYFFSSRAFRAVDFKYFSFTKIYRQKGRAFTALLNKIRMNQIDARDLAELNSRVDKSCDDYEDCIILTPTNAQAKAINEARLSKLASPVFEYPAMIQGAFDAGSYPNEVNLQLKVGAQVLMIKNDAEKRWVNGSIGEVIGLTEDQVRVRIGQEVYEVDPVSWEKVKYTYDEESNNITEEVTGVYEQYPMKLAWAITIHKSQGLTFDRLILDIGQGAFESGQTYVALSRCRDFDQLYLKKPISFRDIRLDKKIKDFHGDRVEHSEERDTGQADSVERIAFSDQ